MLNVMMRRHRYRERPIRRVDAELQRRELRAFLSKPESYSCCCGCGRRADSAIRSVDGALQAFAFACTGGARALPCTSG
jgi:hypothetical protein